MRAWSALLAVGSITACASLGGGGSVGTPALRYDIPAEPAPVFVHADTALLQVDAGGETVDVTVASRATLAMSFSSRADGRLEVRADYRDFDATATNPLGPPETSSEDDVSGPLVFSLTATGRGSLLEAPELSGGAAVFLQPEIIAASFFPRVPGQVVGVGDRWTDTTRVVSDQEGNRVEATTITSYWVEADTTVAGRPMLRILITGSDERLIEGSQGGIDMSQRLTGTRDGFLLWDHVRRLPAEVSYTQIHTGDMEVSAAPFPLAVRVESRTRVLLAPAPSG